MTFTNRGRDTVQMVARHWVFVDVEGGVVEVKGPGARGVTPVLMPGEECARREARSFRGLEGVHAFLDEFRSCGV